VSDLIFFLEDVETSLNQASHPDYVLVWEPDSTVFWLGETPPLKWTLTRLDGQAVDLPLDASVTITDDTGQTTTLTPDSDNSDAELIQTFTALYEFPYAGDYYAMLTLTIEDGQVRSHRTKLSINRD